MKEDSIQLRLREYLTHKSLRAKDFERIVGLGNGSCAAISERTRKSTFDRISQSSLDLNVNWLITGEGEMCVKKSLETNVEFNPNGGYVDVRYYEISPSASFRDFCSNQSESPEFISVFAEPGEVDDNCCVFKIFGDSMAPQIKHNSRLLCREIGATRWHDQSGVVVIGYGNRFVLKRILRNKLDSENFLILGSDNPDYSSEEEMVQFADIRCIFRALKIVSQQIF